MFGKNNKQSGQITTEFLLLCFFLLIPLILGGLLWFDREWSRSKCAYETFFKARHQLILNNRLVTLEQGCGQVREKVTLIPLEDLDLNKGALGLSDIENSVNQVSRLWEGVLRSLPSSSESQWEEPSTGSKI